MLLWFILGYLILSVFLILGLMWARRKGDSVQIDPTLEDAPLPHERPLAPDDAPLPPEHDLASAHSHASMRDHA
jgi:hypothetical protein